MPRKRKPHHHEVRYLPVDPSVPFDRLRALYARLSDDDPKTVSIEHQIAAETAYLESHGLVAAAVYVDYRTGFDPDRLALHELIEDAHKHLHAGVVFYDHYRFHRGVTGAYPIVLMHMQLPEYVYEATRDGYDIANIGIWAGISGMEAETTKRRSMEQRRTRAERGQWMAGMKPYWLDRDPDTLAAVVNPERADAFLHALELYVAPMGTAREACAYLTEYAPPEPRRNAPKTWLTQRFREALRNPALWGELPYARFKDEKDRVDGRFVIRKRVANPAAVAFTVPPLIHKNELERAECRLGGGCARDVYPAGDTIDELITERDGKAGGRPYEIEHPLRHVRLLCACGWRVRWSLNRQTTRDHSVYRRGRDARGRLVAGTATASLPGVERSYAYVACAAKFAKGRTTAAVEPCNMPHLPVDARPPRPQGGGRAPRLAAVWPRVRAKLIDALRDPAGLAEQQRQQVLAEQQVEARSVAEEARLLEVLDAELADLDARENRLYDRYDAKEISKNVYDTQTARLASSRRDQEERKRQLLAQRLIVQRAEQAVADLSGALAELGEIDPASLTDDEWGRILPDLVESIALDVQGEPFIHWHRPA